MSQKLLKGVDTFDAAGWTGSGFGAGEDMIVGVEWGRITNGLNQGAAGSLESLIFMPTSKGIVGGPDDGPLIFNCANSADAKVQILGQVDSYLQAQTKVENLHLGHPRGRARLIGGEFETTSQSSGKLSAAASVVIDEFIGLGGSSVIAYNSTAITSMHLMRGRCQLQRAATTIVVGQDAVLDLDPASAVSWTGCKIFLYGGVVNVYGGEVPSIEGYGGVIDFRFARTDIGSGFGATEFDVAGTALYGHPSVATTAAAPIGAIPRADGQVLGFDAGGAVPSPE